MILVSSLDVFILSELKPFNTWCPLKDHTFLNKLQLQICLIMFHLLVAPDVKGLKIDIK